MVDIRDLALAAAFTSMSLRERWSEPGVEGALELTTLPATEQKANFLDLSRNPVDKIGSQNINNL